MVCLCLSSICLYIPLPACLPTRQSSRLPTHPPAWISWPVCLLVCPCVYLFACAPICPSSCLRKSSFISYHTKSIYVNLAHSLAVIVGLKFFLSLLLLSVLSSLFCTLLTMTGRGCVRPGAISLTGRVTESHQIIASIACVVHNSAKVGATPSY